MLNSKTRTSVNALAVSLLLFPVSQGAATASKLTQVDANKIATTFCRNIGKPLTVPADNLDLAPNTKNGDSVIHWHPHWKVGFSDQADVEVEDATGMVTHYMNSAFFYRPAEKRIGPDGKYAGKSLSQEKAVERAAAILKSTGVSPSELAFMAAIEEVDGDGSDVKEHDWRIIWNRIYHGIPYDRDQNASVEIQADTGEAIAIGVNFRSAPPTTSKIILTKEQAAITALAQTNAASMSGVSLFGSSLEVVQPNTFWQDANDRPQSDLARIAWCNVLGYSDSNHSSCQVWVDAETGDVIGGTAGGILGAPSPKHSPPIFGHQLKAHRTAAKAKGKHSNSKPQ